MRSSIPAQLKCILRMNYSMAYQINQIICIFLSYFHENYTTLVLIALKLTLMCAGDTLKTKLHFKCTRKALILQSNLCS